MRITHLRRVLGVFAAVALLAAACQNGDDAPPVGEPDGEPTDAIVSTEIAEPRHLDPLNASESEGVAVVRSLFTGLIDYDPQTTEPILEVAQSIESEDEGVTWNIVLNDNWTFHDGTPVTADSFINAWNHGAYGPNATLNGGFFAEIAGYGDLQCGTREATQEDVDAELAEEVGEGISDCDAAPPAADTLSGIERVSDFEFTVTLSEPQTFWSERLGYQAYVPLPGVYFEDPVAFDEAPVGNGPFMMDGVWEHNREINVVRYDDYAGTRTPTIGGIRWAIYADRTTAITDTIAGNLDIQPRVDPERWAEVLAAGLNNDQFPDASINYIGFPNYDSTFANRDLRRALSMAIDREAINEAIFDGLRQPAGNILPPVIPGHEETVCDNWTYNPDEAVAAFEAAGGLEGPIEVWFNAGAGHDEWVEAVVNQWGEVLGIDTAQVSFQALEFAEYLGLLDGYEITGPFRLAWGMDYPHPQNFLELLFASHMQPPAGANNTGYLSDEFDATLREALSIADLEEAIPVYQEATRIVCEDVPLAPIYYRPNLVAWNDTVSDVYVDAFTNIDWFSVRVN